jgi:hypothetical protein
VKLIESKVPWKIFERERDKVMRTGDNCKMRWRDFVISICHVMSVNVKVKVTLEQATKVERE